MRFVRGSRFLIAVLALALGASGCASGGGGSGPRGSSTRIVESELQSMQQLSVYDAIGRLRPNWLRGRGGATPVVMVDGNRQAGGMDVLRSLPVVDIQELRYMSAADATTRYGTGFDGGAILVTTKH
ncbi:MAG: hypothetical protein PVJ02_11370 [Gemmatimonadota bacterium]|jgi:hypothetical protein